MQVEFQQHLKQAKDKQIEQSYLYELLNLIKIPQCTIEQEKRKKFLIDRMSNNCDLRQNIEYRNEMNLINSVMFEGCFDQGVFLENAKGQVIRAIATMSHINLPEHLISFIELNGLKNNYYEVK